MGVSNSFDNDLTAVTTYEALEGKGADNTAIELEFTGVKVKTDNNSATAPASTDVQSKITNKAYADLDTIATVIWIDAHGSNGVSPVGLESTALYTNKSN